MCPRCKAELLPRQLRGSPMGRNALRAASEGMLKPDPTAQRIKAKKERKAEKAALRAAIRTDGIAAAAQIFLLQGIALPPLSEECPDCLKRQGKAA